MTSDDLTFLEEQEATLSEKDILIITNENAELSNTECNELIENFYKNIEDFKVASKNFVDYFEQYSHKENKDQQYIKNKMKEKVLAFFDENLEDL